MGRNKKRLFVLLTVGLMLLGMPDSGMAATKAPETRTPISSVTVNVVSYIEAGDEEGHIEVTSGNSQYSVGNTDWGTIPTTGWVVGDEPKIKIYLHARSGNYFDKTVTTKKVVVNGAVLSSVKKDDDNETLILSVKLTPVKGTLEEAENAEWVGFPLGKASWVKVPNATAYELKLFRNEQLVYSVEKCIGTQFDFYPYMTQGGTYSFRVRGIPVSSTEAKYITPGDWAYSDDDYIDSDEIAENRYNESDGNVAKDNPSLTGWLEDRDGWRYREGNGSYVMSAWHLVNGKYYYFDYDGYMLTGWQNIAGNVYYLSGNGDMQGGWVEYARQWYYMSPNNGIMQTGWVADNGKWYYMKPADGSMQTGWLVSDGKWYYLDPVYGGAMSTNTVIEGHAINAEGVWVH